MEGLRAAFPLLQTQSLLKQEWGVEALPPASPVPPLLATPTKGAAGNLGTVSTPLG